jgi:hypothetical protein
LDCWTQFLSSFIIARDSYYEAGDPARLPAKLAGRWGGMNEIVYGEEKLICSRPTRSASTRIYPKNQHVKPNEPTKDGPLSFVLFEFPFTSVSTVSRGHHSVISLLLAWLEKVKDFSPDSSVAFKERL